MNSADSRISLYFTKYIQKRMYYPNLFFSEIVKKISRIDSFKDTAFIRNIERNL